MTEMPILSKKALVLSDKHLRRRHYRPSCGRELLSFLYIPNFILRDNIIAGENQDEYVG